MRQEFKISIEDDDFSKLIPTLEFIADTEKCVAWSVVGKKMILYSSIDGFNASLVNKFPIPLKMNDLRGFIETWLHSINIDNNYDEDYDTHYERGWRVSTLENTHGVLCYVAPIYVLYGK